MPVLEPVAEEALEPPAPLETERNPLEASPAQAAEVESAETETAPPDETAPLPPSPFAEELPPDFWGDDIELPDAPQAARIDADEPLTDTPATRTPPKPTAPDTSAEGLGADPRFTLLQSLFPGFISDWQPAQTTTASAEGALEDAPETPETVDLEEGLDADESEEES